MADYEELAARADSEGQKFDPFSAPIKQLEGRMTEVAPPSAEYVALLAEKKEKYEEYKAARKEMIDYQTAKNNVDRILGMTPSE